MLQAVSWLIQAIQPFVVPICFITAWGVVLMLSWGAWSAVRDSVKNAKRMHQIPCADCQFFTDDHRLKCPIHPQTALSDAAIDCPDYEPLTYLAKSNRR